MKKSLLSFCCLLLSVLCLLPPAARALEDPDPQCRAAIVVDGDYGEVLYEHNGYERMYPASITKIMTSLLVLEAVADGTISMDTPVTASETAIAAITADSSTQNIKPGEVLTVEQLLYCDLVASANEACNILAETVGGSIQGFVELMNQKAAELGMENTHFVNPNGLHDPEHYTTAYDIYLMASAAMKHETFRTIVSTATYTVPETNMSRARTLHNTNCLISNWYATGYLYSKAIGIKTGSTDAAGQCLAAAAIDEEGRTFYCVVLGAQTVTEGGVTTRYSFREAQRLLEWAFGNFSRVTLLDENSVIKELPVTLGGDVDYVLVSPVGTVERTMPTDYDPERAELVIDLPESLEAPVEAGQKVGTVTLVYQDEEYGSLDLVAADGVERSDFEYYMKVAGDFFSHWWAKALVIGVGVLILVLILLLLLRGRRRSRYGGRGRGYGGGRYTGGRRR